MSAGCHPLYIYRATVVNVVDGDTVDLDVDLGFRVRRQDRFRLFGINAPEMRGDTLEAGKLARSALLSMLGLGLPVLVKIHKGQDKYGRWLAEISTGEDARTVNDRMVAEGFAVEYMRG